MATSSKNTLFILAAGALAALVIILFLSTRPSTPEPIASPGSKMDDVMPLTGERQWDTIDNASSDGWTTEVFSGEAEKQLKRLGELLTADSGLDVSAKSFVAEDVVFDDLLPETLDTVFEDDPFLVQRYARSGANPHARHVDASMLPDAFAHRGLSGFTSAIQQLAAALAGAEERRFKAKLYQVNREGDAFLTRQYISMSGRWPDRMLEQNATWIARWTPGGPGNPPRMTHLAAERFEQVHFAGDPMFADCTEAVLGTNESYRKQMLYGVDYWMGRTQNFLPHATFGRSGIAVGDVNGDGRDDLYVCQDKGLPNRLYVQQPDGTAVDVSRESGADWLASSHGALLVDLDGDGDQDLAIALFGAVMITENDGTGTFQSRTVVSVSDDTMSLCAADFDGDADLDLYVCANDADTMKREGGQGMVIASSSAGFIYYDANSGGANSLLRNEGNWAFVDCTKEVGLDHNNQRISYAAAWEDYDDDGDPDLYVANDYGRNNLYRNDGGRFTDVAGEANAEDSASGMSVAWADYDRDGWMDLYVANMFSAAGSRITRQALFKPGADDETRGIYRRFAKGNSLFRNVGGGRFEEVGSEAAVEMGRWAWASPFIDVNNDGWEDLLVANGYFTNDDTKDL